MPPAVHIAGITPNPDDDFMAQVARDLTDCGLLENPGNSIRIPGIDGPLHLRAAPVAILGTVVTRQGAPFATFTDPAVPAGDRLYPHGSGSPRC